MPRCINADKLIIALRKCAEDERKKRTSTTWVEACEAFIDEIEDQLVENDDEIAPVIHAQWIADPDNPFGDLCMCSNCKEKIFDMDADRVSFCPYCGAKMREQKPDPPVGYLYRGADGIARCSCCNTPLRYLVRPFEEMKMCPYCRVKLEPREEE